MSGRREELLHCFGFYLKVRNVNVNMNGSFYFKLALTRLSERDTLTSQKMLGTFCFRRSITSSLEYGILCPV